MISKKVLIIFFIILAAGTALLAHNYFSYKNIETVSAAISANSEDVLSGHNGYLKEFKIKEYENVNPGDIIAEISTKELKTSCSASTDTKNQKAVNEYTDAAMMYKDGVISKEQYDNSLDKYKKIAENDCKSQNSDIQNIIAIKKGKLIYNSIEPGDKVSEETIIAQIQEDFNTVKAYFSPKYKKHIKTGDKAEIIIVKYPEKTFTGEVVSVGNIDIFGLVTNLKINEDVSDINLKNDDAVIVKIIK